MTIGESDCPVVDINNYEREFDEENCVINLDHDNNHICHIVVHQGKDLYYSSSLSRSSIPEFIRNQNPGLSNDGTLFSIDEPNSVCRKRKLKPLFK